MCKAKKSDHLHLILKTWHWLPITHTFNTKRQLSDSIPSLEHPLIICLNSFNLTLQQDNYDLHLMHKPLSPLVYTQKHLVKYF